MIKLKAIFLLLFVSLVTYAQDTISSELLRSHVSYLADDSLLGRGWGTDEGLQAAEYIAEKFEAYGVEPWEGKYLHSFIKRSGVTVIEGQNVMGIVRGTEPGYVIIGAHYDHIAYKTKKRKAYVDSLGRDSIIVFNGADDNASGVATILELGKQLASQGKPLGRSIILVAFDAEESGLIGSRKIITDEVIPQDEIEVMFSVDMVGHYAETNTLTFSGLTTFEGGLELFEPVAEEHDIELVKTKAGVESRTDTYYYGLEAIPALYVSSGIVGPYHKPEDMVDTIDFQGMATIANFLVDAAYAVSTVENIEPEKSFVDWAEHGGVKRFQIGATLGIGFSQMYYTTSDNISKTGAFVEAGLVGQLRLTNSLLLRPEVKYATHGSRYIDGDLRFHSVDIPLNILLATPMQSGFRAYAIGGMYYSHAFSATLAGASIDFDNDGFEQMDYGFNFGFGFQYNKLLFNYEIRQGLQEVSPAPSQARKTGGVLSVGYFF